MEKPQQKQLAFSFLEVGIILLIVSVIFAISYSSFRPYYQKKQVALVAEKIASQIHFLRSQAILQQTKYTAWFDGHTWNVLKDSPPSSYKINYNANYTYFINASHKIYFYPSGRVSFLSIFITNGAYTRRIIIASTGRIRFENG